MTDKELARIGIVIGLALIAMRFPRQSLAVLEVLSAPSPKTAEEGKQAYNDFLSRSALLETERAIRKARDAAHDQHEGYVVDRSAPGVPVFVRLHLFRFDVPPGMHEWRELVDHGRQSGDDFFVIGGDGFRLVVRATRFGIFCGLVRVHWQFLLRRLHRTGRR